MPQSVDQALDWLYQNEMLSFANSLEIARLMWRKHRELVEAEAFPQPYRGIIERKEGYDPQVETNLSLHDGVLEPGFRESLRSRAASWRTVVEERKPSDARKDRIQREL